MRTRHHFGLDERLSILRAADKFRKWASLDDKRVCVLCETQFTGRQVQIARDRRGHFQLHCPTESCKAGPGRWVYPGNPLVSETVYQDWWRALGDGDEQNISGSAVSTQLQYA